MKPILLILLFAVVGCQHITTTSGPERTESAFIFSNSLAGDGCEEHVQLDSGDSTKADPMYKPTAATLPILQNALTTLNNGQTPPFFAGVPVRIRFYQTGQSVSLQCGWGQRPTVPEITILAITKR